MMGSMAILRMEVVTCEMGVKMYGEGMEGWTSVAVLEIDAERPVRRIKFPAETSWHSMIYLVFVHQHHILSQITVASEKNTHLDIPTAMPSTRALTQSSSSSKLYPSPRTFNSVPTRTVPHMTLPNALKSCASGVWYNLVICTTAGPSGEHASIDSAMSVLRGPE